MAKKQMPDQTKWAIVSKGGNVRGVFDTKRDAQFHSYPSMGHRVVRVLISEAPKGRA